MENEIIISKVWLDLNNIYIETKEGQIKSHPLIWFPKLFNASPQEREEFKISAFGIHWEKIDEDLSFEGFFSFQKESITN